MEKLKEIIKLIAINIIVKYAVENHVESDRALEKIKSDINTVKDNIAEWCSIETLDTIEIEAAMMSAVRDYIINNDNFE